ncbi:MAG TPA: hypothetical protein VLL08_00300 [Kineosporiaceae bacterium]|nr:hypothetical protein [Kineosporiaceae bacterium]
MTALLNSPESADYGITMPGTPAEQARAALAVLGLGQGWRKGEALVSRRIWRRLVARARAASGTVVVSSEFLCEADPLAIERIVEDLGSDDLRVVVTLRPLSKILPSAWQQYLKSGHALPYEQWLQAVLADPPKRTVTPSFWRRHDHAAVVERWATAVGPERMNIVVIDDADRGLVLRAFDDLLGLPTGTLAESPADRQNRSMTAAEAELFRRVNSVVRNTDVTWAEYADLMRYGAILRSVERYTPPRDASKMTTPAWALDRATELGAGYVTAIDALRPSGLRVVGDLDLLAKPVAPAMNGATTTPTEIPIDVAVEALLGVVARATAGTLYFPDEPEKLTPGLPGSDAISIRRLPADKLTSRQLADLLNVRVRAGLRRRRRDVLNRLPKIGGSEPEVEPEAES